MRIKSFQNKVVWITGASSGIGEALAKAFAHEGAILLLSARRISELERVKEDCVGAAAVHLFPLDLTNHTQLSEVAKNVLNQFEVDVLVNNGGISQRSLTLETPIEIDRKIFEVNFFGHIFLTKWVVPQMVKRGSGVVVTISSLTGLWGFYLRSAYAASKHALHGFYESLRMEVEDYGVQVSLVTPGFIATDISKHAIDKAGNESGAMDNNQANGISPEECARQIIYGVKAGKDVFAVGGKETRGVWVRRMFPKLFKKILKKQAAR